MRPLTNIQTGTLGGTLCSVFGNIVTDDLIKTIILAVVGTIVSFLVSRSLGIMVHRKRGR